MKRNENAHKGNFLLEKCNSSNKKRIIFAHWLFSFVYDFVLNIKAINPGMYIIVENGK